MKKRSVFFPIYLAALSFILFSSFSISRAQTPALDSLRQILKNEEEDTFKVNTLNAVSDKLWRIAKYDSSMVYANQALTLASELGFEEGKGNAFYLMGICFYHKGNYTYALSNLQEGITVFQRIGNNEGVSKCLISIGSVYFYQGNYPKSLEYFYKALSLIQKNGDKSMSASVQGYIGNIYYYQQNYPEALELYSKALGFYEKTVDYDNEIRFLGNLTVVYTDLREYDTALKYNSKAMSISRKIADKSWDAYTLAHFGEIYAHWGKYDTALKYVFMSLSISKKIGNKRLIGNAFNEIGHDYSKLKKYGASKIYLDSALFFLGQIGDKELIKSVYSNKIELDSAEENYKAELEDNKKFEIFRDSLKNVMTYQEEMNQEFSLKQDSLKTIQVKKDAIKENEIRNQKRIRNYTFGGMAVVVFFLGFVFVQRNRIAREKQRSDELLLNILPAEVADELKEKGSAKAKTFDEVSVMFTDFKGFTTIAEKLSAEELVAEIDYCFKGFDNIIHKYGIEKIKTIGDSYMAAGGLPVANKTHAKDVVSAALEIVAFMEMHKQQRLKEGKPVFEIRIGINTGPVVAGIVGVKKFAYDIWGDTVNLASRMESSGEPGKINISGSTYELVKNDFTCTYRGKIQAKNKGEVDMYFIE